jgi:hypothetical protein
MSKIFIFMPLSQISKQRTPSERRVGTFNIRTPSWTDWIRCGGLVTANFIMAAVWLDD